MAQQHPHSISLNELEKAVTAAVHQLQQQKTKGAQELAHSRLIIGRWIQPQIPHADAQAAAEEITKQVTTKVAGLNAEPVAASFPGGSTMGFVLREE
jgi:hypothetical protein